MNFAQIGALIAEAGTITEEIVVDAAELQGGATVLVPIEPQIGTTGGQPIYLIAYLSTTKQQPHLNSPVLQPKATPITPNEPGSGSLTA